jgi:hypothetical protein
MWLCLRRRPAAGAQMPPVAAQGTQLTQTMQFLEAQHQAAAQAGPLAASSKAAALTRRMHPSVALLQALTRVPLLC